MKKRCMLTIDIDFLIRRRISEIAFDLNISRSELMRQVIEEWLIGYKCPK